MDLNKKLKFYKNTNKDTSRQALSPSLTALKEFFQGEISNTNAPYLKIKRSYKLSFPEQVNLVFLSKSTIRQPVDLKKCLFFDLETTGLAGGSGTYPFLLGFGYFSAKSFNTVQFFLPDFGREYELFKMLNTFFKPYSYLISFNGKSYDLPMLKNRFILNRTIFDWDKFIHIDLLHLSRRVWKDSYPSLELTSIETYLLNRKRTDDIPGQYIPPAYFSYLRTGRIHEIKKIIEHNYLDIISLADLLVLLNKIEQNPAELQDLPALIRLLHLSYKIKDYNSFERLIGILSEKGEPVPAQVRCWQSLVAKRTGDWENALFHWNYLLNTKDYLFFALEELAKHYEHQRKDYQIAMQFTNRAIHNLNLILELDPYNSEGNLMPEFTKRANRLRSKLA